MSNGWAVVAIDCLVKIGVLVDKGCIKDNRGEKIKKIKMTASNTARKMITQPDSFMPLNFVLMST